jgi:amino acid permease
MVVVKNAKNEGAMKILIAFVILLILVLIFVILLVTVSVYKCNSKAVDNDPNELSLLVVNNSHREIKSMELSIKNHKVVFFNIDTGGSRKRKCDFSGKYDLTIDIKYLDHSHYHKIFREFYGSNPCSNELQISVEDNNKIVFR